MTPPRYLIMFDLETGGLLPTQPTISLSAIVDARLSLQVLREIRDRS